MIAFIKGIIFAIGSDHVIVDNQGIGYRIFVANPQSMSLNQEITLFTYQHVREDAIILFGFLTSEEHDLFLRLISVKGVGPKTGLNMMSMGGTSGIMEAIETGNVEFLKKLPGIGAKSAQQIVLDLKGKLVQSSDSKGISTDQNYLDALDALKALGYKTNEINGISKELAAMKKTTVDEYIRCALSIMLKRKGV
ncbi:MAG: Holliday junction branch migration protein RuvA [Erysipelotrichaceae bacterium]